MRKLRRILQITNSRRFLASSIVLLLLSRLYFFLTDTDPQGNWNLLADDREDLSPVAGPSDFVVMGHQVDGINPMIFLYLHRASDHDKPSNLIFRYAGDTPIVSWADATHVVIQSELSRDDKPQTGPADISKQIKILQGIHIRYIGFETDQVVPLSGDKK